MVKYFPLIVISKYVYNFLIFRRDASQRVVRERGIWNLQFIKLNGNCCVEIFSKTNCLGMSQLIRNGYEGIANLGRVRSFQPANCDYLFW